LFKQDGDPLDNSVKANELFKSSENVAAYGELRRVGLSPFKSEEKIKEWSKAAGGMSVGIVSNELVDIKTSVGSKFGEPKAVTQSFREIKLADGTVKIMSIDTGSEVTPTDLTYVETAAKLIKNYPDQVEQNKVAVAQVLTVDQRDILGKYNSLLVQDATDEDRVKAVANNQYAKIMITQDSLTELGLRPKQSQELAAVMHVINTEGMLDEAGWGTSIREEHNLLTDSKGYHPLVAYMAATDIEDGGTSSISFNDNVKRGFLTDYAQNSAFYDSKLSTQARSRVRTMLGDRPEAALALGKAMGVDSPSEIDLPEPVTAKPSIPDDVVKEWRNSLPRQEKLKLNRLSLDEVRERFSVDIKAASAPTQVSPAQNLKSWINSQPKSKQMPLRRKPMDILQDEYKEELEKFARSKNTFINV
jgi:hypothetical protein